MVHADAADFHRASGKEEVYQQIIDSITALCQDQSNWVANLANAASLLWHGLHSLSSPSNEVNWAGFYVLDKSTEGQLILGPFQGKVACQTIKLGRGVCGQAAASGTTILVDDVHTHPDHIACDSETNSEIVVPIWQNNVVVGVIDIDCQARNGFNEVDRRYLEAIASLLGSASIW